MELVAGPWSLAHGGPGAGRWSLEHGAWSLARGAPGAWSLEPGRREWSLAHGATSWMNALAGWMRKELDV